MKNKAAGLFILLSLAAFIAFALLCAAWEEEEAAYMNKAIAYYEAAHQSNEGVVHGQQF